MKILILADGNSIHTQRWVNGLIARGLEIFLFSLNDFNKNDYSSTKHFHFGVLDMGVKKSIGGGWDKVRYLKALPSIRKIIKEFNPDIVHAHFASSYGLLGALSKQKPLIVSVWGYDVFEFPELSIIHKNILKFILRKADNILSTSKVMARRTAEFTRKKIIVTPFGIDLANFKPMDKTELREQITPFTKDDIVIGTVKLLETKYGIDYLLRAFARLKLKHPDVSLKACIVGYGSESNTLKDLCCELDIEDSVLFTGKVTNIDVPKFLNTLDVYAALSIEDGESFGVAIIEASACAVPVVVSNAGGLPEVVDNEKTGLVVNKKDVDQAYIAFEKLILNPELRKEYGQNGLQKVKEQYDWIKCLDQMEGIYHDILTARIK